MDVSHHFSLVPVLLRNGDGTRAEHGGGLRRILVSACLQTGARHDVEGFSPWPDGSCALVACDRVRQGCCIRLLYTAPGSGGDTASAACDAVTDADGGNRCSPRGPVPEWNSGDHVGERVRGAC